MQQIKLAVCQSGVKNKAPEFKNITLGELTQQLKQPVIGQKDGSYFIRTTAIDETIKKRSDSNTTSTAKILIIDADSTINNKTGEITEGAPDPQAVHKTLTNNNINHLIYRSYSHGIKGNRYRILFLTGKPYTKKELPETISHALLVGGGEIAPVKENNTWAQPWYLPRKPANDTSEFTYLSYKDGQPLPVQQPAPDFTTYKPKRVELQPGQISPVLAYNQQYSITEELLKRGDTQKSNNIWLYHGSKSKNAGIHIKDNKMYSWHGSDPLNDSKPHDSFDVMQSRLKLPFDKAIIQASQTTVAPDGQTVDAYNKSIFKPTQTPPAQAPVNIQFNELQPFNDDLPQVLGVPYKALPESLEAWTRDVSSRLGCAPDYLLVCVVTVLSSLLGRKLVIKPKKLHDWEVVPNLWGAFVGTPSTKKSPAMNEALYYITELEKQARLEHEDLIRLYKAELKLLKIDEKTIEKKARELAKTSKQQALEYLAECDKDSIQKPPEKRFIAHDTTVEKLAILMQSNPNGLITIRDELAGLLAVLDREENAPARAFYLQMFNGNQSFSYDRISRESVNIPHCVGSILGGIQPGVLKPYLMAGNGKSEDGLLQRIQLNVYPDPIVTTGEDKAPDTQAKARLTNIFEYFSNLPETPEGEKPETLNFTPEAQEIFYDWEKENTAKAKAETSPAMEAHLSKYPAFIASLALIIHLADNKEITPVSNISLLKAVGLVEYFESHARRIYGMVHKTDIPARSLADKLHKLPTPFKLSDFKNKGWTGLTTPEKRSEALAMLFARGYITEVKQPVQNSKRTMTVFYKNTLLEDE